MWSVGITSRDILLSPVVHCLKLSASGTDLRAQITSECFLVVQYYGLAASKQLTLQKAATAHRNAQEVLSISHAQ